MLKEINGAADVIHEWEPVMDLIGSIKHLENRPDRRKPDYGKGKSVQKNICSDAMDETNTPALANQSSTERDTRLGWQVGTTA